MRIRIARRRGPCAVRLVGASAFIGLLPALFPAAAALATTTPAAASAAHPYGVYVAEAARRFGIPEACIWAVMRTESNGDPAATSPAGAIGLMQVMPGTWAELTARYGLGGNPWDVRANIHAGAAYLREMVDRYGDFSTALAAYNAGPRRIDDWRRRGRPLPAETIAYVARIAPMLNSSRAAAPAAMPAIASAPAAPSWRSAAVFVPRGEGAPDSRHSAANREPLARPGGTVFAAPAQPLRLSARASSGLFVALSQGSKR